MQLLELMGVLVFIGVLAFIVMGAIANKLNK